MTLKSYMTLQTMSGTETRSGCGTETARGYGGDGGDGEGDGVRDDVEVLGRGRHVETLWWDRVGNGDGDGDGKLT